ncbi:L-histidine N(alpha)-methyltransferase [Pseudofrankia sp. BMG5.37]|uniref:L-histidine N(alpha)-methyltransferase n=1 Tax=Pseudofrankia sp. BMG5.37 TaxID=3050035 RepID=UPI002895D34B|nr:L-histidine N(alpha)-methyltransferase [Pseudofrankia sp. BMG5.37]MDT3446625.1 L-histidine N(alpha)-methyltransferase [Pseudofrankia sp. BMG5.37]
MTSRTPTGTGTTRPPATRTPTPADVAALLNARGGITIERHLTEAQRASTLAADAREGLTADPKELPPTWFYDTTGSMLFGKITELPEYYQTRTERAILSAHAAELSAALTAALPGGGAGTLVELGSGTSEKTRMLLAALAGTGRLRRFVPFDVDADALSRAGAAAKAAHPGLAVHAVVGDFRQHLGLLPTPGAAPRATARPDGTVPGAHPSGPKAAGESAPSETDAPAGTLVAFLGGTIGNLRPPERHLLLTGLRERIGRGGALLLGTDLVKDPGRLVAAYDDSAGVTAAFNRNLLTMLNRELGADFDLRGFAHVALWDSENRWIEMRLRSVRAQTVRLTALDLTVAFADGEEMRTEISAKFDHATVERELTTAGWHLTHWWTDPDGDFALSLAIAE